MNDFKIPAKDPACPRLSTNEVFLMQVQWVQEKKVLADGRIIYRIHFIDDKQVSYYVESIIAKEDSITIPTLNDAAESNKSLFFRVSNTNTWRDEIQLTDFHPRAKTEGILPGEKNAINSISGGDPFLPPPPANPVSRETLTKLDGGMCDNSTIAMLIAKDLFIAAMYTKTVSMEGTQDLAEMFTWAENIDAALCRMQNP